MRLVDVFSEDVRKFADLALWLPFRLGNQALRLGQAELNEDKLEASEAFRLLLHQASSKLFLVLRVISKLLLT